MNVVAYIHSPNWYVETVNEFRLRGIVASHADYTGGYEIQVLNVETNMVRRYDCSFRHETHQTHGPVLLLKTRHRLRLATAQYTCQILQLGRRLGPPINITVNPRLQVFIIPTVMEIGMIAEFGVRNAPRGAVVRAEISSGEAVIGHELRGGIHFFRFRTNSLGQKFINLTVNDLETRRNSFSIILSDERPTMRFAEAESDWTPDEDVQE